MTDYVSAKHGRLLSVLLVLSSVCLSDSVFAQSPATRPTQTSADKERGLSSAQKKIDALIRGVNGQLTPAGGNPTNPAGFNAARQFSNPLVKVDDRGRVQVYVELSEITPARLDLLRSVGSMEIELTNPNLKLVQGWVPIDKLETIAALDFVVRVRRPQYGKSQTGSVNTQGDSILLADQVRSALGMNGAGVKVGVLSDGANNLDTSQATGDLPGSVTVFGSCNTLVTGSTCNEGTAMLEIVHDLAPGATLAMGDVATSLEFVQRVTDLTNWGARVIVDDISFFGQPFFEDGPVAQAYAAAIAQGIAVFSSAGNAAQRHYQGTFVDNNNGHHHDFGGGDITMHFTAAPGPVAIILQWSNTFGQAADDYELCLTTDASGLQDQFCSSDPQDGTQDPIEALSLLCQGPANCNGDIRVSLFSGVPRTLEMFFLGANPTEYVVPGDSIFGHPSVPGVISVGAISAADPGAVNIETYSSRGPSTMLVGSPRQTPTLTAIDCVNVTGAGGFPANFCGTSASAPHAAGVAALLLQARPGLTPAQALSVLQGTAADRGAPGFDNTYGAGLIDALRAAILVRKSGRGQMTSPF